MVSIPDYHRRHHYKSYHPAISNHPQDGKPHGEVHHSPRPQQSPDSILAESLVDLFVGVPLH